MPLSSRIPINDGIPGNMIVFVSKLTGLINKYFRIFFRYPFYNISLCFLI